MRMSKMKSRGKKIVARGSCIVTCNDGSGAPEPDGCVEGDYRDGIQLFTVKEYCDIGGIGEE